MPNPRRGSILSIVIVAACTVTLPARGPQGSGKDPFSSEAIKRVVSDVTLWGLQAQQGASDWSRLTQYLDQDVVLEATGLGIRRGRLLGVDDGSLAIGDRRQPLVVQRAQVRKVQQAAGRRGSIAGAIIGGAAGLGLAWLATVYLVNRECSGGCSGTALFVFAAAVGLPTAGGYLGYFGSGDKRKLTTIYVNPDPANR
jgi:hypothetical protein